jgi:putative ABC transport system permease protein
VFAARTWEVGLLRATGLTRLAVFVELLKESLLVGGLGTAVGLPLGAVIGRLGLPLVAMATAANFRWPVPVAEAGIWPGTLMLGMAVGLGASLMAALLPAIELARTEPVAALRMRGRATAPAPSWRRRMMTTVLVLAIVVLVVLQRRSHFAALGHATTILVLFVGWALAMPLVAVGGRILLPLWRSAFGSVGEFAAGQVREQARRAALTIATLGVGLGVVSMFGLLGGSFERTLVWKLSRRMQADLMVNSALYGGGYLPARLSSLVRDEIRTLPGVKAVAGQLRTDTKFRNELRVLDVYDAAYFDAQQGLSAWPLDPGAFPNALDGVARGEGVLVSDSFAEKFDIRAGDSIELESPLGPRSFRVVGVTRGELETAVIMDRSTYLRLWNDPTLTWIHVGVEENAGVPAVAEAIRRQLGEQYRLSVQSTPQLVGFFRDQARQAFSSTYLMEGIIFMLVSVAIVDMLASGVAENIRLFAMLRAMGMSRGGVFAIVGLEGLALAVLGLTLAIPTGFALGIFWVDVEFPALLGWRLDLHIPMGFLIGAAMLTMVLCLAASFGPALRAAYLSVPAALRNE